jgi:hypothetical protein
VSSPERRYRRWLHIYPKDYRSDREEEILGTLLEASSEHGRLSLVDLLHITVHGAWVRSRLMAKRLCSGRLPRSVYIATLLMAFLGALNLMAAAFSHNGPKNQSSHLDNIMAGLVFVGLDLLLRSWRRRSYLVVTGALCVLVATSFVTVDFLIDVFAVFPLILLVIGRKRYLAGIPEVECPRGLTEWPDGR